MKTICLAMVVGILAGTVPVFADDTMYLDTALKDGYQIKGQSSVTLRRTVDGVDSQFSRTEVVVQRGEDFALCAIETNLEKNSSTELACSTFK